MAGVRLTLPGLTNIADETRRRLAAAVTPAQSDLLEAANLLKTIIIQRTAAGKDVNGLPFHPYSTKGPYYYYPYGHVKKGRAKAGVSSFTLQQRIHAAVRLQRKIGGILTRSKQGIRFASYAAFKQALGRMNVDLTGPRAPHMLQAIQVSANSAEGMIIIGIYDQEKAKIARGHNNGIPGRLPQRRFFDTTAVERDLAAALLRDRAAERAQALLT